MVLKSCAQLQIQLQKDKDFSFWTMPLTKESGSDAAF